MNEHVDVVISRWADGIEERVAAFFPKEGVYRVELFNDAYGCLYQAAESLNPMVGADHVEADLSGSLGSTYLTVVPLHDADSCLFAHGNEIPMDGAAAG